TLLALLSQPIDETPEAIAGVEVAWSALAPLLVLVGGALVLMVADALSSRRPINGSYALVTTVIAGGAIVTALPLWDRVQDETQGPFSTLGSVFGVDGFSVFTTIVLCAAVILGALSLDAWLRREGMDSAEPYVPMLLSASGGVIMPAAHDLIAPFLRLA